MATFSRTIMLLSEMTDGQEGDLFALLTAREELKTRDGKPYYRVGFRDAKREVTFPIWSDSPLANPCREEWAPGEFYKLRAVYRETDYGPQLDIRKIRQVVDEDREDGFDPLMCQPRTRFDIDTMYDELLEIARTQIADRRLSSLVIDLHEDNREAIKTMAAARRNHHAYLGGYLEHVLSVTRTAVYLADKYQDYYPELVPPVSKDLCIAGAILHDIGKLRELETRPEGAAYTAPGQLIGHVLQGRDIVREAAAACTPLERPDEETLLRLEHIIVSHQRLPEWGAPKPPMTPEALLVHHADDIDAKMNIMVGIFEGDTKEGPMTAGRNPLGHPLYRGEE